MRVKLNNGEIVEVAHVLTVDENKKPSYIVKDFNWYWNRNNLTYIPVSSIVEILDNTGSAFRDGYELGLVHGADKKEKEMIEHGIIEDDGYYDDDDYTDLDPRFDLYESEVNVNG